LKKPRQAVKLIYLSSAEEQKNKILSEYPALRGHILSLEKIISENPDSGKSESILVRSGKTMTCRERSVRLNFFSDRYSVGYRYLTAQYIYNTELLAVIKIFFS
jgi:hypothetical protein